MHGANMKIVNAQQARIYNIYKNTRLKLLKSNVALWFNKTCKSKNNDEHNRTIIVVLAKHEIAPWLWYLREPKHVGAIVGILIVLKIPVILKLCASVGIIKIALIQKLTILAVKICRHICLYAYCTTCFSLFWRHNSNVSRRKKCFCEIFKGDNFISDLINSRNKFCAATMLPE